MKKAKNIKKEVSFRSLYAFGKKLQTDLSLSENPLGCSPRVTSAIQKLSLNVSKYPNPDSLELAECIADDLGITADNIFISNGSEAIIKLLPELFLSKGKTALIPALTFPMFRIACDLVGADVVEVPMDENLGISLENSENSLNENVSVVFLCNPNNPTGGVIHASKIIKFVESTRAFVVVDEANIEFGGESVAKFVTKLPNLIVLRTFSKGFGLASLRIGFCIASKNVIQRLKAISQPFPVPEISQKLAQVAFKDKSFIKRTNKFMALQREYLSSELAKLGFTVFDSSANNILAKVPSGIDSKAFQEKLIERGVSIVDGRNFPILGSDFIRVSPRLEVTNKKFIRILREIMK